MLWNKLIGATKPLSLTSFVAVGHLNSPFVSVYPVLPSGLLGPKYADPSTLPLTSATGVRFSPNGDALAVAFQSSPGLHVYEWSGSGFGAKYSDPSTTTLAKRVCFSSDGAYIACVDSNVHVYPWNVVSGFGAKYSNPASPPSSPTDVSFSQNVDAIVVSMVPSPFQNAWAWSASGFGSKYSNPSVAMPDDGQGVAFSPDDAAVVFAHKLTPFVTAYAWSSATGYGSKYTNPAVLPAGQGYKVAFSPSGSHIAVSQQSSPYISAYAWSSSTGFGATRYSAFGVSSSVLESSFSKAGNQIALVYSSTLRIYEWSTSGFGALQDVTLPGTAQCVDFY